MKAAMENLTVVLVGVRNAGNIGSAARAMKNMGVRRLALVDPVPFDTPEAHKLAWGAEEILRGAEVPPSLAEAIAGCVLAVGTTRRRGRRRRPVADLREAAPRIAAATGRGRVALVFGREDKGLDNDELSLCQAAVSIPASRGMPSLNVAQAVMVVLYELFRAAAPRPSPAVPPLVPLAELEGLYARLERALALIGYGREGDRAVLRSVMRTLRRVFGRSGIADDELRALHGICQQIERFARGAGGRP